MRSPRDVLTTLSLTGLTLLSAAVAFSADWPAYRHDSARSGVTPEKLRLPLQQQWAYRAKHPPQPAWPEPGKEAHRMDFDYAYEPVVAGGLVYFGSSADNKVYALDLATGQERWSFFAGGPVRFAPAAWRDRVFVASDDGYLYCLSGTDGKLIWRFRAAPRDDKLVGNGRVISRWPLRSGVLVEGDVVYVTAGMWPSEGILVYALRPEDGSIVWCNETSGSMYMKLPHPGSEAVTGVAPQGYLAATNDLLLVPTGRSVPAAFDRRTGQLRYYQAADNWHNGASWTVLCGNLMFGETHPTGPDIDVWLGERRPGSADGLMAWYVPDGKTRLTIAGKHRMVATPTCIYASGVGGISATEVDLSAVEQGRKAALNAKWQTPNGHAYSLILADDVLLTGGVGQVSAFDAATGKVIWSAPVNGQARGLAVADGKLLVSTSAGEIACFGATPPAAGPAAAPRAPAEPLISAQHQSFAEQILKETGVTDGYCLIVGAEASNLAHALAVGKNSSLDIYCVEPAAEKVEPARRALDAAGMYGVRVTVDSADAENLPYPDYFADLVVGVMGGGINVPACKELYRVLRPCGGVAYFPSASESNAATVRQVLAAGGVPQNEIRSSQTSIQIVRGPLPGAGDWTHQYADAGNSGCASDQRVRWPMELLWFGGPGPARMMSRHWKTTAPLSVNGRMFIAGQNCVIAVNAYNGRELWCTYLPNMGVKRVLEVGSNFVADADSVYVATGGACFRLDAATGAQKQVYGLPLASEQYSLTEPQTLNLQVDADTSGTVTLQATATALEIKLVTVDRRVTNRDPAGNPTSGDSWELYFDFRPATTRGGLYGPGAFHIIVVPPTVERAQASWNPGPAHAPPSYVAATGHPEARQVPDPPPCPPVSVQGARTATGSETTVAIPWNSIPGRGNVTPADFAFGVTLNSSDDGAKLTARTHKFANADSYRLTSGLARFMLSGAQGAQPAAATALPASLAESRTWGYLAQWQDLILGSIGTANESEFLFALGKQDGRVRWTYQAKEAIPHTGVAILEGRVFVLDRTGTAAIEAAKRRGETIKESAQLVALDVTNGREAWKTAEGLGGQRFVWSAGGVVLANDWRLMTAYSAQDGRLLWQRRAAIGFPIIIGDTVYTGSEAYDLRTGAHRTRHHPLTGEDVPWTFHRAYGCGRSSAAPTMLFFRSGAAGFYDLAGDSGVHNFGGIRPGCYINIIAANGLVLIPEASSACTCSYNFQTCVALAPAEKNEDWSVFSEGSIPSSVSHVAINLGAPGDRRDGDGTVWLAYPRPTFPFAVRAPVTMSTDPGLPPYRRNSDLVRIEGTQRPWLYASGIRNPQKITVELEPGYRPPVSLPATQPPKLDGQLDDPCWDGREPVSFVDGAQARDPKASVFLRSDADSLYIGFRREPAKKVDVTLPWTKTTTGEDAPVWQDDSWEVYFSDEKRTAGVMFGVSASGATRDGRCVYAKDSSFDAAWDGKWNSAVSEEQQGAWTLELAIPWATLTGVGLDRNRLQVNMRGINLTGVGAQTIELRAPGPQGWDRCERFLPMCMGQRPQPTPRPYTVRLHFAELEDVPAGERVFDVRIQGQTVIDDLDVVRETGGPLRALVKEFKGVQAAGEMTIELAAARPQAKLSTVPILNGLEVIAE